MGNIRFLYDNLWDDGTVTYNDENANFPASNTQHRWWQKTMRSKGAGTGYLVNDLGSALSITVVALKYNNFTAAAAIDLYGDSDSAFSPPTYSQKLDPINQDVMIEYFASPPVALQYWELVIVDAAVPDGYHTIGRIFLGPYFEPTRQCSFGSGRQGRTDPSVMTVSEEGHVASVLHTKLWTFEYTFPYVGSADLLAFQAMFEATGMSRGFFITDDLADLNASTYYVKFAQPLIVTPHFTGEYSVSMSLVESM